MTLRRAGAGTLMLPTRVALTVGALAWWTSPLVAQTYTIPRHVVAGGGGTSTGPAFAVTGTIGEVAGGVLTGGPYAVTGGFWSMPLVLAAPFTDEPLLAGTSIVRAVHIIQLRQRVNALRAKFGVADATWTDPMLGIGVAVIKAQHVSELRVALQAAYTQAGVSFPPFADPVLTPGTPVRAMHVSQLRVAVKNLEEH